MLAANAARLTDDKAAAPCRRDPRRACHVSYSLAI